jgi:hypothetical protein
MICSIEGCIYPTETISLYCKKHQIHNALYSKYNTRSKKVTVMKVSLTIRKRTKIDGISGVATSVTCLCDLLVGSAERGQINLEVPPKDYELFEPGSMWVADLVKQ